MPVNYGLFDPQLPARMGGIASQMQFANPAQAQIDAMKVMQAKNTLAQFAQEQQLQKARRNLLADYMSTGQGIPPELQQAAVNNPLGAEAAFDIWKLRQQYNPLGIQSTGSPVMTEVNGQRQMAIPVVTKSGTTELRPVNMPEGTTLLEKTPEEKAQIELQKQQQIQQSMTEQELARKQQSLVAEEKQKIGEQIRGDARLVNQNAYVVREALNLADKASQGLTGQAKVIAAKIFPDIDIANEAALESRLRQLTMDQLSKFKGPTTDFEYGIAASTIGSLGDPKSANKARLNAILRNNYMITEQAKQFREFMSKKGADQRDFAFDMNRMIKTTKGDFTLQQVYDYAVRDHSSVEDVIKRLNQK